jgi:anti-sigma-K factor RskA
VSSGLGHQQCTESLGAYVLGALPEGESEQVERHLASCRECQAECEWLRVAADALPASVPQVDPPPALKERVMAVVEAEAELLRAAGKSADRPAPRRRRLAWWPSWRPAWRPAAVLGAVGAAAVVVVVVLATGSGGGTRIIQAHLVRLPGARASIVLRGTHAELVVRRLGAPAANHVDEIWVQRGSAPPQPAGTFVVSSGSVVVSRPVRSGDVVLVTVEPGRGTRSPTTQPFLIAHI